MKFNERKNPPTRLRLPGWPHQISYKKLRESFPTPLFVLAFGSAIREPVKDLETTRFLFWERTKTVKRFANDVDLLVVTLEQVEPYRLRNGLPYWRTEGDSYSFWWVEDEVDGAMHLQVTTLAQLEQAVIQRDPDALRILGSCEIIEGDVSKAKQVIKDAL